MTSDGKLEPTRIVVGYDGSPDSTSALEWAVHESEAKGDRLELIATWHWPVGIGWPGIVTGYDPGDDVQETLDKTLSDLRTSHPDIDATARIVQGSPADTLVEASRGARLLVLGTRGHGELAGLLIGSVSQYCAAHAYCPVIVVRSQKVT
jgi:nucleotide-binding universal stress UspA family protein